MGQRLQRLQGNIQKSVRGSLLALSRPGYVLLAVIFSLLVSILIYFSINIGFYGSLLGSSLPFVDKLDTVWLLIESMGQSYFEDLNGLLLLIVSLAQGIALTLLIFNFRRAKNLDTGSTARTGIVALAAIICLGCVPCGTSILIPIMTLLFSSSSYLFLDAANILILAIALLLSIYSLYKMGLIIHIQDVTSTWKGSEKHENK